ncbi:MAG: amidohydrolase family protein [Planctomyces sp.]
MKLKSVSQWLDERFGRIITRMIGVGIMMLLHQIRAVGGEEWLVIENCSFFDSSRAEMVSGRTIVVHGDRIHSADSVAAAVAVPAEATRIDGTGKYVIPGLIDAHVHLVHVLDFAQVTGVEVLPLYLAAGVTSVRSTGDEVVAATLVSQYAESHADFCPRVFTCSPLLDADPPIHRDVGRAVTDPASVPALFDELERWKVTTVKIYARTGRDVGRAIIDESHRRGLFVTAHLGAYPAQEAVADGIDGLEHIWSVFNFIIPPEVTKTPGHRGYVDLQNPLCEELVAELSRRQTWVDPTLIVFRNMILLSDLPEIQNHDDHRLVPARLREFWPKYLLRAGCPQGGTEEQRRREFSKFQELTGKLYRAGVPLLVGTDAPEPYVTPGYSMHTELELLVASGLPPAKVLQAATKNNATVLRQERHLGGIEPGKLADLVILTANPLDDIRNTRAVEIVVRSGKVCRPAELLVRVPKL